MTDKTMPETDSMPIHFNERNLAKSSSFTIIAASFLLIIAAAIASPAQTFTTLVSFDGTSGANPFAGLVQGFSGNLYGITPTGGSTIGTSDCPFGCGTIFKLTPSGALSTLYNFCSPTSCPDGELPYGGLVLAANGNLYGATAGGGVNGYGTVFEITPKGMLRTLYSFCSQLNCADGSGSITGLVQGPYGNFYGTAVHGGTSNTCPGGCGTIFRITPDGALTTIYSFCSQANCADGEYPQATLVQGLNGDFYGTTGAGGNPICGGGCGTVFATTAAGNITTLHTFCSQSACTDGQFPAGALVQATNGNLYGVTSYGGVHGSGTIFEITPQGKLTTLYSFCGQSFCAEGAYPYSGLAQAADGSLYGATEEGGAYGHGSIFQITPAGSLTQVYSFCPQNGCADGAYPETALMQATNGQFYGTTYGGGIENSDCSSGCGTVFGLSTGMSPFVETLPTSGRAGQSVVILGNNLTGSTQVSFNGTSATFKVVSPTEIRTSVPAGATAGKVTVATSNGTLTSNIAFHVRP